MFVCFIPAGGAAYLPGHRGELLCLRPDRGQPAGPAGGGWEAAGETPAAAHC